MSEITAKELNIGMIGLDTSHSGAFTRFFNDANYEHLISAGKVTVAYPGGSADMPSSISRVNDYTEELSVKYGVRIVSSIEAVAEQADAIMLTSLDGRVHPEQFLRIAQYGKPAYINKPFALSVRDAETIFELADKHKIALLGCSSLRYADPLTQALLPDERGEVIGADAYSPMPLEPNNPGWFYYGVHAVEMLYTAMSKGCRKVQAFTDGRSELVVGTWEDGRVGTARGNRENNHEYGITISRQNGSTFVNPLEGNRPFYMPLMEELVRMFRTGVTPLDPAETLEITRFMEAANESRASGAAIVL